MKIYFLDYGWLEGDLNWMVALSTYATKYNRNLLPRWEKFPEYGVLIEEQGKYILYDTGSHKDDFDRSERFPFYYEKHQGICAQLEMLSLTPADIDTVILSHLHDDHCGNIDLFSHAKIYIDKDEYENVKAMKEGKKPLLGSYKRFELKERDIQLIEKDTKLTSKIELIRLPGHSCGLLGLFLHVDENQKWFIVSDALDTEMNYKPKVKPSLGNYDEYMYCQSVYKIKKIEETSHAKIFFGHDMKQFSGLKKCPEYYDFE